jgi:RHS repeat-associated protein
MLRFVKIGLLLLAFIMSSFPYPVQAQEEQGAQIRWVPAYDYFPPVADEIYQITPIAPPYPVFTTASSACGYAVASQRPFRNITVGRVEPARIIVDEYYLRDSPDIVQTRRLVASKCLGYYTSPDGERGPLGWYVSLSAIPICGSRYRLVADENAASCQPFDNYAQSMNSNAKGQAAQSGPPKKTVGDPIEVDSGALTSSEADYSSADGLLRVERHYRSQNNANHVSDFGLGWRGLLPGKMSYCAGELIYHGNDGSQSRFMNSDNAPWQFTSQSVNRLGISAELRPDQTPDAYFAAPLTAGTPYVGEVRLSFADGSFTLFSRTGTQAVSGCRDLVPVRQVLPSGYSREFDYPDQDSRFASRIGDSLNRELNLSWIDAGRTSSEFGNVFVGPDAETDPGAAKNHKVISEIGLPDGTRLSYQYGAAQAGGFLGRLDKVQRLAADGAVLWGRGYLHENAAVPLAMTGTLDQTGSRIGSYTYNSAGRAIVAERAGGHDRHEVAYDDSVNLRTVTNPLGLQTRFAYHGFDVREGEGPFPALPRALASESIVGGQAVAETSMTYGYDAQGLVSFRSDGNGVATSQANDAAMLRPTTITDRNGVEARLQWHPVLDLVTREERPGLTVNFEYDAGGQLIREVATDTAVSGLPNDSTGQQRLTAYSWAGNGRLAAVDGPQTPDAAGNDDIVLFTYDAQGNRLSATNPLGHVTRFSGYDANGRPGEMIDANGTRTQYGYDALGRIQTLTVKHPDDPSQDALTRFAYDVEGRVTQIIRPDNGILAMDYDLAGRLTALRTGDGERIDYTHDAMGNILATSVKRSDGAQARAITRVFDGLGRIISETRGPGRTTSFAYDRNNNPVQMISPRGNVTLWSFDALDRLVTAVTPATGQISANFDARDNPVSFVDAIGIETTFIRNGFGDVLQEISPDRGTSSYEYDAAGRMIAATDGRGQRISYRYDILGRLTAKLPDGRPQDNVRYIWDVPGVTGSFGIGRLSQVEDATGITKFAYDHRGNVITKQQKIGSAQFVSLRYQYDLADRIVRVTYPSGRQVRYSRDGQGRVDAVHSRANATIPAWTAVATGIRYEPFGPMRSANFGNGLRFAASWGDEGQVVGRRLFRGLDGANLSHLGYSYDADGNITRIRDNLVAANSVDYRYDVAGRLIRVTTAAATDQRVDYSYDANGNRLRTLRRALPTDTAVTARDTYFYDNNRLSGIEMRQGGAITGHRFYSYDERGNMVGEDRGGGQDVIAGYDAYGRLTGYARRGGDALVHAYNGLDDRVVSAGGGGSAVQRFVYDERGRVLGEYGSDTGQLRAEFIWMMPDASADDGVGGYMPLAVALPGGAEGSVLAWIYGGHLGVPIITSDASGAIIPQPGGYNAPGFPGQSRTHPDLYYNRYRDFDPLTGRYIQADPIGLAGGPSPYSYALNNPVRYMDPDGRIALNLATGIIGGAVGGGTNLTIQLFRNGGCLSCVDGTDFLAALGTGAVAGFVAPVAAPGILGATALGGLANVAQSGLSNYLNGEKTTAQDIQDALLTGMAGGALGGGVGYAPKGTRDDMIFAIGDGADQARNEWLRIRSATGVSALIRNMLGGFLGSF